MSEIVFFSTVLGNLGPRWSIFRIRRANFGLLLFATLDIATLFSKVVSSKLRGNVKNEIFLISVEFGADLIDTSIVTSRKTKWPRFLRHPVYR